MWLLINQESSVFSNFVQSKHIRIIWDRCIFQVEMGGTALNQYGC